MNCFSKVFCREFCARSLPIVSRVFCREYCTGILYNFFKTKQSTRFFKRKRFSKFGNGTIPNEALTKEKTKIEREPFRMWEIHLVGNQTSIKKRWKCVGILYRNFVQFFLELSVEIVVQELCTIFSSFL